VIVIVFGVSGAGKTTIGKLLAKRLGWRFLEADDFHPRVNVEKMHNGLPLTDEDRWPWLERLREQLTRSLDVKFVLLRGDCALVEKQLHSRHGHFMSPDLLRSQFADLEEPESDEDAVTIELGRAPEELVEEIEARLRLAGKDSK
jgi:gluconokinase